MRSVWAPQEEKRRNFSLGVTHFSATLSQLLTDHDTPINGRNGPEVSPLLQPQRVAQGLLQRPQLSHTPAARHQVQSPLRSEPWPILLTSFRISDVETMISTFLFGQKKCFQKYTRFLLIYDTILNTPLF